VTQDLDRVVVVGAGLGGVRTVEALRRRGYGGEIVLLGAERHLPYDRPPLSKQVLRGQAMGSLLRSGSEWVELDVDLRLDTPASRLVVDEQVIQTSDGQLGYDAAIIATGAAPRRLPQIGGRVLRTLDDALVLRSELRAGSRLVVIGAGLVGCEVAASARELDVAVALVDVLPAPAVRVLGPRVGQLLAELHDEHGVGLHMGTQVLGSEDGRVSLEDGTELDADVVLESIGVRPDTDWLADSGLGLQNGVMCDGDGRAGDKVYAVGDVANWAGKRQEHWTNVGFQANHVTAVMLGQEMPATDVSYWWSDQYDLKLQGLGSPAADDDVEVVSWGPKSRTVAVYSKRGLLTGLVGFSAAGAVMRLGPDIAAGTDVGKIVDRLTRVGPGVASGSQSRTTSTSPAS
jgi:3-phenylpropionate/trans-cinnamate dioxygenase ferredoxin reductase subunit